MNDFQKIILFVLVVILIASLLVFSLGDYSKEKETKPEAENVISSIKIQDPHHNGYVFKFSVVRIDGCKWILLDSSRGMQLEHSHNCDNEIHN